MANWLIGVDTGGTFTISIALMTRPKLLLLDEPSAGLAPLVQRLFEMIRVIRDRFGTAVLQVEQNVNEALRIVDRKGVFSGAAANKEEIVRHLWRRDRRTY